MQLYNQRLDVKYWNSFLEFWHQDWKDYKKDMKNWMEESHEKYGRKDIDSFNRTRVLLAYFNGIGVLVQRGDIDVDLVMMTRAREIKFLTPYSFLHFNLILI
jgi:hypothetical protein